MPRTGPRSEPVDAAHDVGELGSRDRDLGHLEGNVPTMVEIDPQMGFSGFTRRVTRGLPIGMMVLH